MFSLSLQTLSALLKSFPKKLATAMNDMLAQIWSCLVQCSQIYVSKVVNSNADNSFNAAAAAANNNASSAGSDTGADFEDEKTSFENLIYQLFEFILVLKEKGKYRPIVRKAVDELCYFAILFMQITDDQVHTLSLNIFNNNA